MYGLASRGFISWDLVGRSRSLATSSTILATGKEHRQRKQAHKRREDKLWKEQKSLNPFTRNVGAARQLQSLELDVDDPTFKTEDVTETLGNLEATIEDKRIRSKAFRAQFKADEEYLKDLTKRKIIEKKLFPKPPNPSLLTWMEK